MDEIEPAAIIVPIVLGIIGIGGLMYRDMLRRQDQQEWLEKQTLKLRPVLIMIGLIGVLALFGILVFSSARKPRGFTLTPPYPKASPAPPTTTTR
jgi:hypothetical protein